MKTRTGGEKCREDWEGDSRYFFKNNKQDHLIIMMMLGLGERFEVFRIYSIYPVMKNDNYKYNFLIVTPPQAHLWHLYLHSSGEILKPNTGRAEEITNN